MTNMNGCDLDLVELIRAKCTMPITVLGGAGSLNDIKNIISRFKIIGVAAEVYLYLKKYKAVLINYPNEKKKNLY